MRPLDLFVEKHAGDRGIDFSSSQFLSREINGITMREWMEQSKSLSTRDKMSIASASIALGSPFFLLSLGAAFAMVDQCDNQRIENELNYLVHGRRPYRASQDVNAVRELDANILRNAMSPLALMSMDLTTPRAVKPKKERSERKDQSVFASGNRKQDNCKFLVEDQSWLKASKVLKQKFFLQDELERVNGQAEFSQVAGIVAQIERLDKELKRLGC